MRQQSKPFIVEIKQPRKLKPGAEKSSIWGKLDLRVAGDRIGAVDQAVEPADSAVTTAPE